MWKEIAAADLENLNFGVDSGTDSLMRVLAGHPKGSWHAFVDDHGHIRAAVLVRENIIQCVASDCASAPAIASTFASDVLFGHAATHQGPCESRAEVLFIAALGLAVEIDRPITRANVPAGGIFS